LAWLLWWLAIALHWLAVALHGLTVALHWLAVSLHGLSTITLWLLSTWCHDRWHSVLLGLAIAWLLHLLAWLLHGLTVALHWLAVSLHGLSTITLWLLSRLARLSRLSRLSSGWLTSISRRSVSGRTSSVFLDQVVLLKVTAELVVVDALLELDQDVVQLHVELSSLLEQGGELLLYDDGLVDLLEELILCRVAASLSNCTVQGSRILLDRLAEPLFLLLQSVILGEMSGVLLFEFFIYGTLVCLTAIDLHEFFDCVVCVNHGDSVVHDLFLADFDRIKLVEGFLHGIYCRVVLHSSGILVLWDGLAKLDARFSEKLEAFLVTPELLLDLYVCCRSHLDLALVVEDLLFVGTID